MTAAHPSRILERRLLPRDQLTALLTDVVRAGLDCLEHDRDFNRTLIHDQRTDGALFELAANPGLPMARRGSFRALVKLARLPLGFSAGSEQCP